MSAPFDPYYTWLGIPPAEQPADHYRLLGIPRFEKNPNVIEHAADRQMAYLKTFNSAKHTQWSQKLLNEVAQAKVTLLSADKKAAYDLGLAKRYPAGGDDEGTADGAAFEQYELLDQLSSSRTGQVFKARHKTMGRVVALKILSREAVASEQLVERFIRKVKILARMSHPNLVAAYEAGRRQGTYYLAMEFVDGQDLRTILKDRGRLPVEETVSYVIQAAAGLGYAHSHGVYHRNVKPSNLLVDKQGVVKLVGLGLAHVDPGSLVSEASLGGELTAQGQVMGTYDFMAPEQAVDSSTVDPRADIYSLGCTLHALLTGRAPYPGKSPMQQVVAHRSHPIPSLRTLRSEVPEQLDAVFQKMMAKRPEDRHSSMAQVIDELEAAMSPAPAAPEAATPSPPVRAVAEPPSPADRETEQPAASRGFPVAAVATVAVLALVAVLLFLTSRSRQPVRKPAPQKPAEVVMVIDWPEAERAGGQLEIDGRRVPLADIGPIKHRVPAGQRKIVAMRPSFETFEQVLRLAPGAEVSVRPSWRPSPEPPPAPKVAASTEQPKPTPPAPEPEMAPKPQIAPKPKIAAKPHAAEQPVAKRPVPAEEARQRAEKLIRQTYQDEFQRATDAPGKIAAAKKFLDLAMSPKAGADAQYLFGRLARDMAMEAGDRETAWAAIAGLDETFDIDPFAMKADLMALAAKNARSPDEHRAVAIQAMEVLREAMEANSLAAATALGKLGVVAAGRARDKESIQKARGLSREVEQAVKASAQVGAATATLAEKPNDPEANRTVGRYECLVKGNWEKGLANLSRGPDSPLRSAALRDIGAPQTPAERIAVADAWFELAETELGVVRKNLQMRAAHWYWLAAREASGGAKAKVEKRVQTLTPLVNRNLPSRVVNKIDGSVLLLIGGGAFFAGEERFPVELPPYYLGVHEVSNAQYKRFIDLTEHRAPEGWQRRRIPLGTDDHPVAGVTWADARDYCKWAGLRLPTELEWEKAARGLDGRIYPWGNVWDFARCFNGRVVGGQRLGPVSALPEGRSPYGLLNMCGNAGEYCADRFQSKAYQRYKQGDLTPPTTGGEHVVRGGSTGEVDPKLFRCDYRGRRAEDGNWDIGFRVAHTYVP